jgi:DNA-binding CsgD family transcriptional regulator
VDTDYPTADLKTPGAWIAAAFLLGAIACDTLGGPEAAGLAMAHALDLADIDLPIRLAPDSIAPLTDGEIRILRYLPSNLTVREIAGELYLSANTVRTHMQHLYRKLDAHTRSQAIARARALGLLRHFRSLS